jgi:predicted metal-dependent hydrolase
MTYIKSEIDGRYYLVQNNEKKIELSNFLAKLRNNILTLSNYLYENIEKYDEYKEYISLLNKKAKYIILIENTPSSVYTSYSINKGEKIVFCLTSKKNNREIHDMNLVMYVVLHELAHVACPIYDNHGPLFRKIFYFLTEKAMEIKLYKKIDFSNKPEEYCGMIINDSII